jgi:hypothetical protein
MKDMICWAVSPCGSERPGRFGGTSSSEVNSNLKETAEADKEMQSGLSVGLLFDSEDGEALRISNSDYKQQRLHSVPLIEMHCFM